MPEEKAAKAKSPEQLLKEYDDACADVVKCLQAVNEEERKPRTSPAHVAFEAAMKRKLAASTASINAQIAREAEKQAATQKAAEEVRAKEQARIEADFSAKGGKDVTAEEKA